MKIGKVVCVGRNYADHAKELNNDIPDRAILFIKPSSSVVSINQPLSLPKVNEKIHFETELCLQINKDLNNANIEEAKQAISAVTLGLDLTLRELQSELKSKGHPWERSKAFSGSCVLADWIPITDLSFDLTQARYQLYINDELRQHGDASLMLFSIYELIVEISEVFGLQAGDVIMTGTPKGVGSLSSQDQLKLVLQNDDNDCIWTSQVL